MVLIFDSSGRKGQDSISGHRGYQGRYGGGHGGPGTNASPAVAGEPAGQTNATGNSGTVVRVQGSARNNQIDHTCPGTNVDQIRVTAIGGLGGVGARGGDGGAGGRGYRGRDATQWSYGTDGGPGGDGGRAGYGSHGAPGGSGGQVQVKMHEQDTYLLMAVESADNPEQIIRGGVGGRPGSHGVGGSGGPGGWGGSSYSWTTYSTEYYSDAEGRQQSRTVSHHHYNPGGCNGRSGYRGHTPSDPLRMGAEGYQGNFLINVIQEGSGAELSFVNRYNLQANNFSVHEFGHKTGPELLDKNGKPFRDRAPDGVFEFGQMCYLDDIKIDNFGGMPTPKNQRQRIKLNSGRWIKAAVDDEVFTIRGQPVQINEVRKLLGQLRFQIGMMDIHANTNPDFEPIVVFEQIKLAAEQLGIETQGNNAGFTEFRRGYDKFGNMNISNLKMQFPIQNNKGFLGLSSLAAGEGTALQFPLKNISSAAFGYSDLNNMRGLGVHIFLTENTSISANDLEFTFVGHKLEDSNKELNDDDAKNNENANNDIHGSGVLTQIDLNCTQKYQYNGIDGQFKGYFFPVPNLPGKYLSNLKMLIKLKPSVPPYAYGELRSTIYIENLDKKSWVPVQKRLKMVRCEPTFLPTQYTQAILVTSQNTTQHQFMSWMTLLTDTFNLQTAVYSVSRYGGFGPKVECPKGAPESWRGLLPADGSNPLVERFLPGCLVVVLDGEFEVDYGTRAKTSDLAVQGWAMRTYSGNTVKRTQLEDMTGSNANVNNNAQPKIIDKRVAGPSYLIVGNSPSEPFESSPHLTRC